MEDCTKSKQHDDEYQSCGESMDQQEADEGSSPSSLLQHSESAVVSRHETNEQASNSESKEDAELKNKEVDGPHIPQTDSIASRTVETLFLNGIPVSNPFGLPVVDGDTIKWAENNVKSKEDAGFKSKELGGPHIPQTVNTVPYAIVGTRFPVMIPISNPLGYTDDIPQALMYNYGQMQGSSGLASQTASTTPFDVSEYFKDLPPSNPFGLDPPWDPFLKGELPPGFKEALETMPSAENIHLHPRENTMTRAEMGDEAFDRFVQFIQDTENDRPPEKGDRKYVVDADTITWGEY